MANDKNRIGVELGLDGVKKVEGQLSDVADAAKAAAAETGKAFDKAADQAATASGEAAQEAETAAQRIRRAFAAVATTIKRALATVTRSVAGVSMSITRGLGRAGVAGGRALVAGIRSGIERSKGVIQTALAGVTAGAAGVFAGAVESSTFAELQARFARAGGTSLGNFGELSSIARQFGAADDELLGAFSTFSDKLAEASRGEGAKAFFDELGISATDAQGKVRDTGVVFRELTQALRNVKSDSKRANFANELLGGDAEKLASVLALSTEELNARSRLAREAGTVVSPEQLARTRRFLDSWRGLQETFRGLLLTVSDRVYPALARLFDDVAKWVRENRKAIADWISTGFNRLIGIVRDLFNAFTGNRGAVERGWVLALADILTAVGRAASNVLGLFSKFGPTIGNSLGKGVVALRDFAAAFLVAFGSGGTALDLFGTDAKSNTSNRIVENIDKNGVQKTQARFAKKGERVLPFVVDEKTAGAAVGFAGALSSLKKRVSDTFAGFNAKPWIDAILQIKSAVILLWNALSGDEQAQKTIVDAIISSVDRLIAKAKSKALQDAWLLITGRRDQIRDPENSVILQLESDIKAFIDAVKPWAEGLWKTLLGRGQELPADNPVKQLTDHFTDLKNQVKEALDNIKEVWNFVENMTGITPIQAMIYGMFLKSTGITNLAGSLLGGLVGRGGKAAKVAAAGVAETASTGAAVAEAGAAGAAGGTVSKVLGKLGKFAKGAGVTTLFVLAAEAGWKYLNPTKFSELLDNIKTVTNVDIRNAWDSVVTSVSNILPPMNDVKAAAKDFFDFVSAGLEGIGNIPEKIANGLNGSANAGKFVNLGTVKDPDAWYWWLLDPTGSTRADMQRFQQVAPAKPGVSADLLKQPAVVRPFGDPARSEARPAGDMRPVVLQINGNQSGTLYGQHDVVNALTRSIERSNRLSLAGK